MKSFCLPKSVKKVKSTFYYLSSLGTIPNKGYTTYIEVTIKKWTDSNPTIHSELFIYTGLLLCPPIV